METFSVSQFKARCLAVIERVRVTGQAVSITKKGKVVVQVVPAPPAAPGPGKAFGCMARTDWEALQ
jgi:prevent-host-death family protein